MKQASYGSIIKRTAGLLASLIVLACPAYVVVAPYTGLAQNKPQSGATVCAVCRKSVCQRGCSQYREQKVQPKPSPDVEKKSTPAMKPTLQSFYPSSLSPNYGISGGGMPQSGSSDSKDRWAEMEAWSKQAQERLRLRKEAEKQAFERKKQEALGTGSALKDLRNVFADDKAWDTPVKGGGGEAWGDPNVVDLSGFTTLTPRLLRTEDGSPIPEPLPSSSATEEEPVDKVVPPAPIPSSFEATKDSNDAPIPPEPLPPIPSTKSDGDSSANNPTVVDFSGPDPELQYLQVPWDQSRRDDGVTAPGNLTDDALIQRRDFNEWDYSGSKYGRMEPAQLDELASQHSNNMKLQDAITTLKEKITSVNNCGIFDASELDQLQTRRDEVQRASLEVNILILNDK